MKKYLLSLAAFGTITAQASNFGLLVGVDYTALSSMNQTWTGLLGDNDKTYDFTYRPITFKVGLGTPGERYMYIYYQSATPETDGHAWDVKLNEVGYEYFGQFDTGSKRFFPAWMFGVSYGWHDMKGSEAVEYDQDTRRTFGLKLGGGISYYVIPEIEFVANANYQIRFYQALNYKTQYGLDDTVTTYDSGFNVVIGVNIWPFAR